MVRTKYLHVASLEEAIIGLASLKEGCIVNLMYAHRSFQRQGGALVNFRMSKRLR